MLSLESGPFSGLVVLPSFSQLEHQNNVMIFHSSPKSSGPKSPEEHSSSMFSASFGLTHSLLVFRSLLLDAQLAYGTSNTRVLVREKGLLIKAFIGHGVIILAQLHLVPS